MAESRSALSHKQRSSFWRRWALRFGGLFIVTLTLFYFAPAIVARTSMRSWILTHALEGSLCGTVQAGGASLGWFQEPEFTDVDIRDEAGSVVLHAPHVRIGKRLWSLALNGADLGTIAIDGAELHVVCAGDESNVEKVLAPLFQDSPSGSVTPAMTIRARQAKVTLRDEDNRSDWTLTPAEATMTLPAVRTTPIAIKVSGTLVDSHPAQLDVNVEVTRSPALAAKGEVTAERFPLAVLAPLWRRIDPKAQVAGRVSGNLSVGWSDGDAGARRLNVDGEVSARDFAFSHASLGSDRIELAKLDLPCKLAVAGRHIQAEKIKLTCDLGEASLSGQIDFADDPLTLLQRPGLAVSADVDLARLSRMLPQTLHLKQETKITSGRLGVNARSTAQGDAVAWTGGLFTLDLKGEHQGQPLSWDAPVMIEFAAVQKPGALPQFDKFKCVSEFLKLDASGTPERLTLAADVDLGRASQRLSQFVDLGEVRPAGKGTLRATLQRDPAGNFQLAGSGQVTDVVLALPGRQPLREKEFQLRFDGAGCVGETFSLRSAGVYLASGAEGLDVVLQEPLDDLRKLGSMNARLTARGQLARWHSWLAPLVDLPADWRLAGAGSASAKLRYSPEVVELNDLQVAVRDARFQGAGLNVNEPTLTLQPTTLRSLRSNARVELLPATVVCPAATVQLSGLTVDIAKAGTTLGGRGTVRGDMARLLKWVPNLATDAVRAAVDGPIDFQMDGGKIALRTDVNLKLLTVGDPAHPAWTEPNARLSVHGSYDLVADTLQLDELRIETAGLGAAAIGRVARLSTSCDLTLAGQINYDMQQWQTQLRPYLGSDAVIAGRDRRPFRLEGSLASTGTKPASVTAGSTPSAGPIGRLRGEASANWQSVNAYGFQVGAAEVKAQMFGDGWLRFPPVEASINQGKLRLEPYIRLDPGPMELVLGKSTRLDHARITPAACARSLGYAMPAFAGAKDAEGEMSLIIEGGRVPLADPLKADIWGKFILHSARATPSPLVNELNILLLHRPANLTLPREITVPVRLVNQRVYHENFELPLGEVTVRTTGSVGLDGSLSLAVETPIPPKWLGKSTPPGAAKQTLKIPVSGTLAQPKLDQKAVQQALAQHLRDTADKALRQELEKELQRLFRPPGK